MGDRAGFRPDVAGCTGVVLALSDALDLVSPRVVGHHKRVAGLALAMAKEMDLPAADRRDLVVAAALHDCGAFTLRTRLEIMEFDMKDPQEHAERGYLLLKKFPPFKGIARIVRYHHLPWEDGLTISRYGAAVPPGSRILHLADRVSVLIDPSEPILEQKARILETINQHRGTAFEPGVVEVFNAMADREHVWLDAEEAELSSLLPETALTEDQSLDAVALDGLTELFFRLVDFRSPYTATHTSGVRACAETLAELCGFSKDDSRRMGMAAGLHDLGKLGVPAEILDKRGALTHYERSIIRGHPYHGHRILARIPSLRDVNEWASFHHERLDGRGYPFHLNDSKLSTGCRIMSVADVFTAVTEERPYRARMKGKQALRTLYQMAAAGKLDGDLVALVSRDFERFDVLRARAQKAAGGSYRSLILQQRAGNA